MSISVSIHHALILDVNAVFNPITPQGNVLCPFEDLLLAHGLADGHKPMHTLRSHIDHFFDSNKLEKHAT